MTLESSLFQASSWPVVYIWLSLYKTEGTVSSAGQWLLPYCFLITLPVKSGRALSSTRRSGRTCFCSRRFLAAVRDVKISFSAMSKPSFVSLSSSSLLHSFVVFVTNRMVTGALRSLIGEEQSHIGHSIFLFTHSYINLGQKRDKGCRWKDCTHPRLTVPHQNHEIVKFCGLEGNVKQMARIIANRTRPSLPCIASIRRSLGKNGDSKLHFHSSSKHIYEQLVWKAFEFKLDNCNRILES